MPTQQDDKLLDSFELEAFSPLSSRASVDSQSSPEATQAGNTDPERQPLIQQASSGVGSDLSLHASTKFSPRHNQGYGGDLYGQASGSSGVFKSPVATSSIYHSAEETSLFNFAFMEKVKNSKVAHYANKFACETEPGLTSTQLMLYNHDLKPVEPERRQWGAWNFVGFWVGMVQSLLRALPGLTRSSRLF
jgi:hypothetical protein